MYYRKMDSMPKLPEDLLRDLLEEAVRSFVDEKENRLLYHRFEFENENSLNFMKDENLDFYKKSGGVTAVGMSDHLHKRVLEFFKQANNPITNLFDNYGYVYVEGGPFCAPHIDDVSRRRNGFQLLMKAGGQLVKTAWYEPKEELKNLPIIDYCGVPYSRIDLATETCLEENNWYWMKFDSIHSVENLESLRIFLVGGIEDVPDVKYLLD